MDNFSVRWTGSTASAGGYQNFTAVSDDGVRVKVDGTVVIDNWTDHAATTDTVLTPLTAGTHRVVVEFYEKAGHARMKFSSGAADCGSGFLAEYFPNTSLSGSPVLVRCEDGIDYSWGAGGPGGGLPVDNFSVRWTGVQSYEAGAHNFTTVSDDGVRVKVDGTVVIDNWTDHAATTDTAVRTLTAGTHGVIVEYYERTGAATASLRTDFITSVPLGSIDSSTRDAKGVFLTGWAMDPDTPDPIDVAVTVNGAVRATVTADSQRPDVEAAHGNGANHGFTASVGPVSPSDVVCVRALDASSELFAQVGQCSGLPMVQAVVSGLEGFDPGLLMTDATLYDASTMSVSDVQSFLDTQGASCSSGSDGSACLKSARFAATSHEPTTFCPNYYPGGPSESAAEVVVGVSRACGVNPQALLGILQKEQGLVTTTNPSATKYEQAMGFRCPDGSACEPQYAGFANQVYSAASRLQQYRLTPTSFTYRPNEVRNVAYSPTASCGGTSLLLRSQATAALYNYTPYQPNQASLAAVSGTGDTCSSYGNRNLFRYMSLWFGTPNTD